MQRKRLDHYIKEMVLLKLLILLVKVQKIQNILQLVMVGYLLLTTIMPIVVPSDYDGLGLNGLNREGLLMKIFRRQVLNFI